MILCPIQGPRLHPYQEIKEEDSVDADDRKVLLPIHPVLLIRLARLIQVHVLLIHPAHQIHPICRVPVHLIHQVRVVPHPLLPILV